MLQIHRSIYVTPWEAMEYSLAFYSIQTNASYTACMCADELS